MKLKAKVVFSVIIFLSFFSVCIAEDFWMKLGFDMKVNRIFYTCQDELYVNTDSAIFVSKDRGNTWDSILIPVQNKYTRLHYIDKTGNTLFCDAIGDLFYSNKDTISWKLLYQEGSINDLFMNNNNIFLFDWGSVTKSNEDWTEWTKVLEKSNTAQFNAFAVDSTGTVYAGSIDRLYGRESGIYRSYDDGDTWEWYPENYAVYTMAVDSEGRIFTGCFDKVIRSTDNGDSWQNVQNLSAWPCSMLINGIDEIYIGASNDWVFGGVAISKDHGDSWQMLNSGLDTSTGAIYDMAESPDGYIYLATDGGVYRSVKSTTGIVGPFPEIKSSLNNLDNFSLQGTLDIELANIGTQATSALTVRAHTDSRYIILSDSIESWASLAPGESLLKQQCFSYIVTTDTPDNNLSRIIFDIKDENGNIFYDYVEFYVNNPKIKFEYAISGQQTIYSGDNRDITIRIKNESSDAVIDANSTLIPEKPELADVFPYSISLGTLLPGDIKEFAYNCDFADNIPTGTNVRFILNLTSGNVIDTYYKLGARIGMHIDFETGDISQYEWNFYGGADWIIDSTISYEGKYSLRSPAPIPIEYYDALIRYNYIEEGEFSFYARASYADALYSDTSYINRYAWKNSAFSDWTYFSFPMPAGEHMHIWRLYRNEDATESQGLWIDNILATGIETGIVFEPEFLNPNKIHLLQNYPNPFNSDTSIEFYIPYSTYTTLMVFNVKGELIKKICDERLDKGIHRYSFQADDLNSGVYFYRLSINGKSEAIRKMIYLR